MAITFGDAIEVLTLDDKEREKLPYLKGVYKCAVYALEKQMPKKPEFIHMLDSKRGLFQCGCRNTIIHDCYSRDDVLYCQKCGQKQSWSKASETEG